MYGWHACRHDVEGVAENDTFRSEVSRRSERFWAWLERLKPPNPPPSVTHFLQQGYIHYNGTTPPDSATPYEPMEAIFFQTTTRGYIVRSCLKNKSKKSEKLLTTFKLTHKWGKHWL